MSTKAARTAAQLRWQAKQQSMLAEAHECAHLVSNNWISHAAEKPPGVSDIRWRMELRRRADPDYYARCENP